MLDSQNIHQTGSTKERGKSLISRKIPEKEKEKKIIELTENS